MGDYMKCKPSKYIKSILKTYIISALIVSIFFASGINLKNLNKYLNIKITQENATWLSLGAYKKVSDSYSYVVTPSKETTKKTSGKILSRGNKSMTAYLYEQNQTSGIPKYFAYHEINTARLHKFLVDRNSLLAEEPYFSSIISTAKEFDLNPLILFSITGMEQSFVPKTSKSAYKIANNPYNVYYSWQRYNTNIKDTSRIAARTVLNLCESKPPNTDAFYWINKKYAQSPDWWKGVNSIFKELFEYTT